MKVDEKLELLLVGQTFFTYICRPNNNLKAYEHKTKEIYLTRR